MKKIIAVIVSISLIFTLVGCQGDKGKEVGYDSFLEELEKLDYELSDLKAEYDISDFYSAIPLRCHILNSEYISIILFEGENVDDANSLFEEFKLDRKKAHDKEDVGDLQENKDVKTFTLEIDGYYIYVGLKNNVVITISSMEDETAKVKDFIASYNWE